MSIRAKIAVLNNSKRKKVAIIGFGASGIMTFHNLVRFYENNAKSLLEIYIFDKSPINKGVAYSTKNVNHLLNVRAKGMSAVEEDSLHFVNWLNANGYQFSNEDFVPRVVYGLYLEDIISQTQKIAKEKNITVVFKQKNIETISIQNSYFLINEHLYHYCVSCVGAEMKSDNNFWNQKIEKYLSDEAIHLRGCGLTAFDAVVSLVNMGYNGTIYLHSRTNHMPQVHSNAKPLPKPIISNYKNLSCRQIVHEFIKLCKKAVINGEDWRSVFDSIRPITSQIWQQFSVQEKQSFVRHCLRYWNIHRHRCPKQQYEFIQDLINSKKVILTKEHCKQNFIDCTGFCLSISNNRFYSSLISSNITKPDDISAGIYSLNENFFIIGAANFGTLFETTAVPELKSQTQKVANSIIAKIS